MVYDLPVRVISRAGHCCIGNYYFMYYVIDYFIYLIPNKFDYDYYYCIRMNRLI